MARFEKYKRGQVGHVFSHALRRSTPRDAHVDPSLSYLNYGYIDRDKRYFQERLRELECGNRYDMNVFAELIVTKPKTFQGSTRDFFDTIHRFAVLNYKDNNMIYSEVHQDEPASEPHIHIGFIPTYYDRKRKKVVVSYDKCVYSHLADFHRKLSEYCEKQFGYDIGIINGATKDGNKSISQLKAESMKREAQAQLHEAFKIVAQKNKEIDRLYEELSEVKKRVSFFERIPLLGLFIRFIREVREEVARDLLVSAIRQAQWEKCEVKDDLDALIGRANEERRQNKWTARKIDELFK